MQDITKEILRYRDCLRNLWNNYFIYLNKSDDNGDWQIDDYFNELTLLLFDSMIGGQLFNKDLRTQNGFYFEIKVEPIYGPMGLTALWDDVQGIHHFWKEINLKSYDNDFHFIKFFDWSNEIVMDCQYVKVKLNDSKEIPNMIGKDFLLAASYVKYLKNK